MTTDSPRWSRLAGPFGCALTVDVEEWYHTCLVPEFVQPELRPRLPSELEWLLPEVLELLDRHSCRATFFVLGEVAESLPHRIREIVDSGHEVACHGFLHLRVCDRRREELRRDIEDSRDLLEDLVGTPVRGFRAPEWSFRNTASRGLRLLAELGFDYDSSLASYPGAGTWKNERWAGTLRWSGARPLVELPPLAAGGRWRWPATGWPGRLMSTAALSRVVSNHRDAGGLPVMVVHPWELSPHPTPGELTGVSRFVHEMGRSLFRERFPALLDAFPWTTLEEAMGNSSRKTGRLDPLEATWVETKG